MDDEPLDRLDAIELAITQVTYAIDDLVSSFGTLNNQWADFHVVRAQLNAARRLIGTEDTEDTKETTEPAAAETT
jgi:hypothetical protein